MNSVFRKILLLAITLLTIFVVLKWDLIQYGLQQAKGQFLIMYNAKPLDYYLIDPIYPDSLKTKIELTKAVKSFATTELAFSSESQYNEMYDQQGKESMWVVTAAYPYSLDNYEWKFPVLGRVTYKGFFIEAEALKLEQELRNKGFDVRLRTASAWSTLGWFNDPLLSNVLHYSNGRLAELVFHELTHDAIFIKDSIDFNENLATFFGREFTKMFFKKHQHQFKDDLNEYLTHLHDRSALNSFVKGYLPKFDSLYQEIKDLSTTRKEELKYDLIKRFKQDLRNKTFSNPRYTRLVNSEIKVNNAYLLSFERYSGHQKILKKELDEKFGGDVLKMLDFYQKNFDSL